MKDGLLDLLPKPIRSLLLTNVDPENKLLVDYVISEAQAYGFTPNEVVPCIQAAYYVFESTSYPEDMLDEYRFTVVFLAACRSAMKLLSYGKYKAEQTESGWMKYKGHSPM